MLYLSAFLRHFLFFLNEIEIFNSFILQIRSSITHLFCASKDFSWWRHSIITVSILAFTNLLVIFVPTIRDIFGFIGKICFKCHKYWGSKVYKNKFIWFVEFWWKCVYFIGASAAAMLIFILPSAFYIKLVKKESMKSVQKIGVS